MKWNEWMNECMNARMNEWFNEMNEWMNEMNEWNEMKWNEMNEWMNEMNEMEWNGMKLNEWMNKWMNEWMNEMKWNGMNEWMKWMNEWMKEWNEMKWNEINEWMNERMNEWMNEWMKNEMIEWMDEWMNEMNEWMNEWLNDWMNEWMNEWIGATCPCRCWVSSPMSWGTVATSLKPWSYAGWHCCWRVAVNGEHYREKTGTLSKPSYRQNSIPPLEGSMLVAKRAQCTIILTSWVGNPLAHGGFLDLGRWS